MRKHDAQPAQGFAVRAFETSEVSRARSLAELLRATQTNLIAGLDPKLAEQEKSLRQSLKVKEDYKVALLGKRYKMEELAALEAELARLQAEYKQVNETIRASYPSYEQITRPAAWDLRQIQEQVIADDQTVLLEYSLGSEQSYVWAVTRDGIKSYNLPARALVNEAAQKVYKLLAAPPGPDTAKELTPAVQELGRMVLSPVAAGIKQAPDHNRGRWRAPLHSLSSFADAVGRVTNRSSPTMKSSPHLRPPSWESYGKKRRGGNLRRC